MNRRDFLVSAATATAGMSARSYSQVLGANDRVGLGVIGLGRRGTIVSAAFLQDDRVSIRAVSDVYDAQTNLFLSRLIKNSPQPAISVAYEDLLGRKDVDAVLVATPDHLHVDIAKDTLEAGKHIYLEKPTLHHWSERKTLVDAASAHKLTLQCGMQQRSGAHYLRAKKKSSDSRSSAK
jgi:predicted dehydrogenase